MHPLKRTFIATGMSLVLLTIYYYLCKWSDSTPPFWALMMFYFITFNMENHDLRNWKDGENKE